MKFQKFKKKKPAPPKAEFGLCPDCGGIYKRAK